jgi:hypothetical protein
MACNNYLNLYYAYSSVYDNSILFIPRYVFVRCLEYVMCVYLLICPIWKNQTVPFSKLDCPVLSDRTYASLNLNFCEPRVMCITYYLFTHTFVAHLRYIHIGGALLDFLENVQNGILGQN